MVSQRKSYEVSENSDPWTSFLGTLLHMCWGGGQRPGSLGDRSPRAGPGAWAASPTSWGNTHSTKPEAGKDGQRRGMGCLPKYKLLGQKRYGGWNKGTHGGRFENFCESVCVCVHAHMCRNHQVPTCARIKETFDKWSISLEPLWNLPEIALSADN